MSVLLVETDRDPKTPAWLALVDRWSRLLSDRVNPILVKETRQALKSRQFLITFSLLLIAAFGWTVIGSLLQMPRIYTTPTAPYMLVGYYLVLAMPMLLVVPLAAYRSLESELDDGTLELLSISALSPWQIVLGKLASAALQMTLYFVALFPCVAFAYTLRGIDMPTLLMVMGFLFLSGLLLTTISMAFAPQARSRGGRTITILVVLGMLLAGEYAIGASCITMILYGIPFEANVISYAVIFMLLTTVMVGNLVVTATAMMLTPESENRSTRLRLSMLLLTAVMVGLIAFGMQAIDELAIGFGIFTFLPLGILWLVAAAMMASESSAMTPRIRRELPSTFLGRVCWTYLTPGPGTGLVFGITGLVATVVAAYLSISYLGTQTYGRNLANQAGRTSIQMFLLLFACYGVLFLVATRWLVALLRRWQNLRVEVGLAAFVFVGMICALAPYAFAIYWNDSFQVTYDGYQITNWAWTLSEHIQGSLPSWVPYVVAASALFAFVGSVIASCEVTLPRKTMLPARVALEMEEQKRT